MKYARERQAQEFWRGLLPRALDQGVEIGKVIGRMHLALDNREDLDLIEPTG